MFAESALLAEPACALIYATPIEFYHRPGGSQAKNLFDDHRMLPNPPVCSRPAIGVDWREERQPAEDSLAVMRKIVTRRLEARNLAVDDVISPDALTLLAQKSGGIMRDLIRYFRDAATIAQISGKARIDDDIAADVIAQHTQELAAQLHHPHREAIRLVLQQGALTGGQSESVEGELLRSLRLLSYQGRANFWYDAHPNVLPLL
jgi:hypothetical protein